MESVSFGQVWSWERTVVVECVVCCAVNHTRQTNNNSNSNNSFATNSTWKKVYVRTKHTNNNTKETAAQSAVHGTNGATTRRTVASRSLATKQKAIIQILNCIRNWIFQVNECSFPLSKISYFNPHDFQNSQKLRKETIKEINSIFPHIQVCNDFHKQK
jgi:hypothetical protein